MKIFPKYCTVIAPGATRHCVDRARRLAIFYFYRTRRAMTGDETAFRNARQSVTQRDARGWKPSICGRVAKVTACRRYGHCGNTFVKISFNADVETLHASDISKNSICVLPYSTSYAAADTRPSFWNKQVDISWSKSCSIDPSTERDFALLFLFSVRSIKNVLTLLLVDCFLFCWLHEKLYVNWKVINNYAIIDYRF